MLYLLTHMVLLFSMTFLLGSCLTQFIYFISNQGFLGAYGTPNPLTGHEMKGVLSRLVKDAGLAGLFVLQHSLMARNWWKRLLLHLHIYVSERLLYVIMSSATLTFMITHWESTPDVLLWGVTTEERPLLWLFFFLLHTAAWVIIFLQIRLMHPFELIGVKQVYYYHKGKPSPMNYLDNGLRLFYQHLRHSGATCLLLMLWVHPNLTLDRFLLALLFSFYLPMARQVTHADYRFACQYYETESTTTTTSSREFTNDYGR